MAVRRSAAWGAVALLLLAAGYCCVGPGASRSPAALHDYARWRFGAAELPSAREQPARRWLQEQPEGAIADANATAIEAPSPPPPSPPLPRLDLRERLAALLHSAPEVQWTVVWQEVDPTFSAADDSSSNSTSSGNSTAAEAAAPAVDAQGASTPSPPPAPAPSVTDMGLLIDCLNAGSAHNATSWASATASDAVGSNLRAVASFTLNATAATLAAGVDPPPAPPKPTATLVTASSIDRLQQLHAQCRAWPGALSAVLFLGLLQEGGLATGAGVGDAQPPQQQQQEGGPAAAGPGSPLLGHTMAALQEALLQVAQFMVDMRSAPHACQPTVLLTYEIYSDRESMLLYPVNLLRNLARIQAQSPLIAMLDVDLLPSKSLANRLVAHEDSARLLLSKVQQDRAVYIVPAFEPAPEFETASWAEALASSPSKEIMVMAMDKGIVTPFHFSRWAVGHQVTNFSHWHDSGTDYDVQYQMHCEPWLVGDRVSMPWHDVRYRGFGFNKMQHVLNLANDAWQFRVLGDSYCIHRPHKVVDAKGLFIMRTVTHQGMTSLRQHVEAMYNRQVEVGAKNKPRAFVAPVTPAEERCRGALPWWAEAERQLQLQLQEEAKAEAAAAPARRLKRRRQFW